MQLWIRFSKKRCFECAARGLWKKPDISGICFGEKQSFQLTKYTIKDKSIMKNK